MTNRSLCKTLRPFIGVLLLSVALPGFTGDREIGGYVAQAESRFQRNVWNFIKNFNGYKTIGENRWKYSQYFWAEPFEFTTHAQYFADSMDLAYVAAHGGYYQFACHSNIADVDLRNAPGYGRLGSGPGGDLEFLVIESCSTIASAPEFPSDWWSAWLRDSSGNHIFQGLHQAIGFRTLSVSDNGIPNNFANRLKGGQAIWQAWFDAVNNERSMFSGSVSGAPGVPYPGWAAVILYPGLDNDSLAHYGADPPYNHGSLRTYWQY